MTFLLLGAYGRLHWKVLFQHDYPLQDPVRTQLLQVLGYLEVYHLTALLSVGFGVWAFWGQPRWIRWVCLPVGLLSLFMFIVVM